jgi:type II secretory pathway pseudopilin PulG
MKLPIRILLLGVIVVLGFTAVFPEWFDLKDQVIAEREHERAQAQRRQQDNVRREQREQGEAALIALEPEAEPFAEELWAAVEAGNYEAAYESGTVRFQSTKAQDNIERLEQIYEAVGPELTDEEAQTKPGYTHHPQSRVYARGYDQTLISESRRWSENALLLRTLELKREGDQLAVDGMLIEVFAYPDNEQAVSREIRRPHVFR